MGNTHEKGTGEQILREGFVKSLPIFCSYIFLGIAYGILFQETGLPWYLCTLASLTVYTGAFQFVLTSLMAAGASLLTIAVTAFLINSRQTFYAVTFLPDFQAMGSRKPYMVFSLTDETFAVNCTLGREDNRRRQGVMWAVAVLSHLYWITGSTIGAVVGQLIPFSMEGIDFCMTALFVIIFLDQWEKADTHFPALLGLALGTLCLFLFGKDRFMLPTLLLVSAVLVFYNARGKGNA